MTENDYPYVALFTQATGIHPSTGRLLTIDAVTFDAAGRVGEEFHAVVNPGTDPGPAHTHGLTPHDLRRTFGRYAEKLFGGGRIVSQLLHHTPRQTEQAQATSLYNEQEWHRLREAFGKVEESMIATSPRVWNRLKGVDKQRLDDSNDSPIPVFKRRRNGVDHGSDTDT